MENFSNWIQPFSNYEFLGIELFAFIKAILIFVVVIGALKIFKIVVLARLKKISEKTKTDIDDAIIKAIDDIGWPLYVVSAFYFSFGVLSLPEIVDKWTKNIFLIVVVVYVILFLFSLLDFGAKKIIEKRTEADEETEIFKLIKIVLKILLWVGALVLILANMGYNVTSLVAGLGIGGIAVGLALQNILGDLFASLAIYLDKPFQAGDFIVVGDKIGTIKRVGIKTTRIDSLQGEEIIMSNMDLTNSRVQNFGRMDKRRVVFSVGVSYETSSDMLKKIPTIVKEIISKQDKIELDRVNFKEFGDSSLNYETVYYVASADYNEFMDAQEKINLAIVEAFRQNDIEIAYPTRMVYLKK